MGAKVNKFWDLLLVREDGHWMGFRSPFNSLQRAATYFVLLCSLGVVATTGWILSRWQVERLSRKLSTEKLRAASLEAQLNDLRGAKSQTNALVGEGEQSQLSFLPSLDANDFKASDVDFSKAEVQYDGANHELAVNFDISRTEPNPAAKNFYWVVLLHGARGVMAFPAALSSRNGELVQFHRGQLVEAVKAKRSVFARYKLRDFIESSGADPIFATINVYDAKGSLMARKRVELSMRRRGNESAASSTATSESGGF